MYEHLLGENDIPILYNYKFKKNLYNFFLMLYVNSKQK
jgi:hypothetical protein